MDPREPTCLYELGYRSGFPHPPTQFILMAHKLRKTLFLAITEGVAKDTDEQLDEDIPRVRAESLLRWGSCPCGVGWLTLLTQVTHWPRALWNLSRRGFSGGLLPHRHDDWIIGPWWSAQCSALLFSQSWGVGCVSSQSHIISINSGMVGRSLWKIRAAFHPCHSENDQGLGTLGQEPGMTQCVFLVSIYMESW